MISSEYEFSGKRRIGLFHRIIEKRCRSKMNKSFDWFLCFRGVKIIRLNCIKSSTKEILGLQIIKRGRFQKIVEFALCYCIKCPYYKATLLTNDFPIKLLKWQNRIFAETINVFTTPKVNNNKWQYSNAIKFNCGTKQ